MSSDVLIFYTAAVGFGCGVLLGSVIDVGATFPLFVALLAFFVAWYIVASAGRVRRKRWAITVVVALVGVSLGMFRVYAVDTTPDPTVARHADKTVTFEGVISDEVVTKATYNRVVVRVDAIIKEGADDISVDDETNVLLYAPFYPEVAYGDRIRVSGELTRPENFTTETGREFDYKTFLKKDDIYFQIFRPEIARIEAQAGGSALKRNLFALKRWFIDRLNRLLPQPHAGLAAGVTVGAEDSLGEGLEQDFRDTGIIHIVVLSGYNVAIVADGIRRAAAVAPFALRAGLGILGITLFALLVGAGPTIVRASIMAGLVVLAGTTARKYRIVRALVLAGVIMVLHNPLILAYDLSFQLSFLATLGLILVAPSVERYLGWMPSTFGFREFATATIATQIFVLPLLLYSVGTLSIVAPIVNILVLPAVPLIMALALPIALVGSFSAAAAFPMTGVGFVLLDYVLKVTEWFARLPFDALTLPAFPLWAAAGMYVVYGAVLWRMRARRAKEKSRSETAGTAL